MLWCLFVPSSYVPALSLFLSMTYNTTEALGKQTSCFSNLWYKIRWREVFHRVNNHTLCSVSFPVKRPVPLHIERSSLVLSSTKKTASLVTEMIGYHSVIQSPKLRHLMSCRFYRVSPSFQFAKSHTSSSPVSLQLVIQKSFILYGVSAAMRGLCLKTNPNPSQQWVHTVCHT